MSVSLSVTVDPASITRLNKRLDKWQGRPLEVRLDKALGAGARIFANGLKARAPKGATKGLSRSVKVRRMRDRKGVVTYRIMAEKRVPHRGRTALLSALLVYGTKRGVEANPFVAETQRALEPQVRAFVDAQVRRLA